MDSLTIELRRQADQLHGVLIAEGRASTGGRREVFIPGAVEWLASGVDILPQHRAGAASKVLPERQADGRITFTAPLSDSLRAAWDAGRRHMSVEFHAMAQRTAGGIREISRALVVAGAMVSNPEYDTATIELRAAWLTDNNNLNFNNPGGQDDAGTESNSQTVGKAGSTSKVLWA